MSDEGIRRSFTREGLEKMTTGVLQTFSDQPQLVIDHPGLAQELLGDVLRSVSAVNLFKAEPLASVTVAVALETLAKHPELLKLDYAKLVAGLAGKVAALVKEKKVTAIQGQDLVKAAVASLAENPPLLLDSQNKFVETVIDVVVNIAGEAKGSLIAGTRLTDVLNQVLGAVAVSGRAALANHPIGKFSDQLAELLQAGLIRAEAELGNRMGLPSLPNVLGQLVVAWAQGEVATVDPNNDNFKRLFAELAKRAQSAKA